MNRILFLFLSLSLFASDIFAQPANDDCQNLIALGEAPVCPPPGIFTNLNATQSDIGGNNLPSCFTGAQNDVWFSFTVPANGSVTDFSISVSGTTDGLIMPQIAMYRGDCSELQELFCAAALINETSVDLEALSLTPGLTYFLRVNDFSASATPNWGEFELCIAEFVPSENIGDSAGSSFCSGTLFDSGGPDGDYGDSENFTYTVCPNEFTQCIEVNISEYNLETGFDVLNIYAGNSNNGIGILTLTGAGSDVVVFSPDQCVTFEFTSDLGISNEGFELSWSCSDTPCDIPPFSTCNNPDVVAALPFTATDLTTCTAGNSVNAGPCGNANYLLGNEYIFTYTSPGDECITVNIDGSLSGTGISIFSVCPDVAVDCISQTGSANIIDPSIGFAFLENPGTYYIAVANDLSCTPFNISIETTECPNIFPSAATFSNALGLNGCTSDIPAVLSVAPGEGEIDFINENNNGCIGAGPLNYTFFFFEAAIDGVFAFTMQAADPNESSDIDFNVWGPINNFADAGDFILNNMPVRSSYAGGDNPTGLADIHPILGTPVTDNYDCNGDNDDFVSTIPVQAGDIYVVWINDWGNEIVSGAVAIDFGATTPGVLDPTSQSTISRDTAICAGAAVQLLATGGDLYEWTPAAGLSCTDCPNPIATPTVSTEYQVAIVGVCDASTLSVTVDVLGSSDLQDATVCLGEQNQLNVGPEDPNITYTWVPATNLSCNDCPNPIITANTPGSTDYVLTINAPGCTVVDNFAWTVTNNVAPTYNISENAAICVGENINIGGANTPGVTYNWTSIPSGFSNTTANPNVSPSVSTNYLLEISNMDCPFSSFDSVLVDVAIPPILDVANDTILCLGNEMSLGSTVFEPNVTYTWTPNNFLTDETRANTTANITTPGNYTYTLTAVRGACTVTETVNIEVIEIALEIENPDTTLACLDDIVTLNVTSLPASIPPVWSPATGLNTTTGNTVTLTAVSDILYTATISAGLCTYTDSVLVVVDSLPEVLNIMPLDTMVCQGSIVELTTTTFEPILYPDIEFLWTPDTGFESPDSLFNIVISANATQTFTRTTTNGGCISQDTARIEVMPIEEIIIFPAQPVICSGESVNLDSDADTKMLSNIFWMPISGLSCITCADPVATPSSTTTYMVTGTQEDGCPASGRVTIEVANEPNIIFPDVDQCAGDQVNLNLAPAEPGTTYTWSSPDDPSFSSNDANPVITLNQDISYDFIADNGVCPSVDGNHTFTVVQEPTFAISPDDVTICAGDEVPLEAISTGPGTYTWTPGADNSSIVVTPSQTTNYTSTFTWGPNCGTFTDEVLVTVEGGFNIFIEANPDERPEITTINQGDPVALSAVVNPASTDIVSYAWFLDDNPIGTNSPTLTGLPFEVSSTYTVVATSANGCTSQDTIEYNVIPPSWEIPSAFTPNGDNRNDVLEFLSMGEVNMRSFNIYNRWGQKVFTTKDPNTGWDGTHNGSMAPSDVYVYVIILDLLSGERILKGDITLIR